MFWEHEVVGSNPTIPISPCDAIGRRALLSSMLMLVRVQPGVSYLIKDMNVEVAAKWMASGLENRGTAESVVGVRLLQLPSTNIVVYAHK